jgi:hypothetical protein
MIASHVTGFRALCATAVRSGEDGHNGQQPD